MAGRAQALQIPGAYQVLERVSALLEIWGWVLPWEREVVMVEVMGVEQLVVLTLSAAWQSWQLGGRQPSAEAGVGTTQWHHRRNTN
jgi:hypothetical protein